MNLPELTVILEHQSLLLDVGRYAHDPVKFNSSLTLCLVNRWLSVRFNLLSSAVVGVTGVVVLMTPSIDAALAGFALAFASNITNDVSLLNKVQKSILIGSSVALHGSSIRRTRAINGEKTAC